MGMSYAEPGELSVSKTGTEWEVSRDYRITPSTPLTIAKDMA